MSPNYTFRDEFRYFINIFQTTKEYMIQLLLFILFDFEGISKIYYQI